jgi:hypothetical protein
MELTPLPEQIELPPRDVQEVYSAYPLEASQSKFVPPALVQQLVASIWESNATQAIGFGAM